MEKLYDRTGSRHITELQEADARHEFSLALKASENQEAAFQGEWRKIPFPEREYDRLQSNVICAGLGAVDDLSTSYELRTTLPNGFVGISYKYNDTGQSEGWMKSVLDESSHDKKKKNKDDDSGDNEYKAAKLLAADEGVVRAQVQATMQNLLIQVQDKVMTDAGILKAEELRVANWESSSSDKHGTPELVEQPVWGIDCYTRRNVMICLSVEFDSETALEYIEQWLLPAVNACPANLAHDLSNAARILEGIELGEDGNACWSHSLLGRALTTKIKSVGPPWLPAVSLQLRRAINTLGYDFFRVHPKGHGSIVLSPKLKANTLVTYYKGEVYPSWRWGEKMDAIEMTQQRLGLRPNLPDFYNMALERPQTDPRGYGLMIVDASRKAGHGSMLSHSCEPTCEVRMASHKGILCLAMTTLRDIEQGEELTFDYNAVTESITEYSSAVCLCGFRKCRGSFLHFATADCYQQVLNRNSPIAVRFANLVKGCMKKIMSTDDENILSNHGFGSAAFGAVSFNRYKLLGGMPSSARLHSVEYVPVWLRTCVADILRYIEYERRALPVALLCDHLENFKVKPPESLGKTKPKIQPKSQEKIKATVRDKPENTFFYYCRQQREHFTKILREKGELENMKGLELEQHVKRATGIAWKALSEDMKAFWKQQTLEEWKKNLAAERRSGKAGGGKQNNSPVEATVKDTIADASPYVTEKRKSVTKDDSLSTSKISFEAADAEGISAMEQRIQQLTQALSRIGRVLDRHRQTSLGDTTPSLEKFNQLHAPLSVVSDEKVIRWMWTDSGGPVQSLLQSIEAEKCASPALQVSIENVFMKYHQLTDFSQDPSDSNSCNLTPSEARQLLVQALFELRDRLLDGLKEMDKDARSVRRDAVRKRKAEREMLDLSEVRSTVASVLQDLVSKVAGENLTTEPLLSADPVSLVVQSTKDELPHILEERQPPQPEFDQNEPKNQSKTILLVHRELARLFEEIRRRDGPKLRLTYDADYINMHASSDLLTYIDEKSKLPTFHKNVLRSLVPARYRDCFDALREMIRKRLDDNLPIDDLMEEGPINIPAKEEILKPKPIQPMTVKPNIIKEKSDDSSPDILTPKMFPWLDHFEDRWKLEAAADLLVFYARTSTFFELVPYSPLKSTPIGVYARELGNAVPKSKIEVAHANVHDSSEGVVLVATTQVNVSQASEDETDKIPSSPGTKSWTIEDLCEPDDVITNVTVGYDGDFVLSQLLQWYNGGIGQKPGLPDMLGCVVLPAMSGCFDKSLTRKPNKANPKTVYASDMRQVLVKWLEDPRQRGSPIPEELRHFFSGPHERFLSSKSHVVFLGSPILDLLVMGDDSNIILTLEALRDKVPTKTDTPSGMSDATAGRLQSTVDEGMPAQAVANWVQCENPKCLKWRKVPWNIDLDMLPEKFFCKDNLWNVASNSCDAPEDSWDENDTQVRSDGIEKSKDVLDEEPRDAPKKSKKKTAPKAAAKPQAPKTASKAGKSLQRPRQSPSPSPSQSTLSEELSVMSEGELLCKELELSSAQVDDGMETEPSTISRLPRKKPSSEQNCNSGLLSSFAKPPTNESSIQPISRKSNDSISQKPGVGGLVPRKAHPSQHESPVQTGRDLDVPRKNSTPLSHRGRNFDPSSRHDPPSMHEPTSRHDPLSRHEPQSRHEPPSKQELSSQHEPLSRREPMPYHEPPPRHELPSCQELSLVSGKASRWGPRLTFHDDDHERSSRNGSSRSGISYDDFYDEAEAEAEFHDDKPHPLLGYRFLPRKW